MTDKLKVLVAAGLLVVTLSAGTAYAALDPDATLHQWLENRLSQAAGDMAQNAVIPQENQATKEIRDFSTGLLDKATAGIITVATKVTGKSQDGVDARYNTLVKRLDKTSKSLVKQGVNRDLKQQLDAKQQVLMQTVDADTADILSDVLNETK